MNCDRVDDLLSDYIDDELDEAVRAAVAAHLTSCDTCAASCRQILRTVRFVRKNGRVPIRTNTPGDNYAGFMRALSDPASQDDPIGILQAGAGPAFDH